MSALAVVPDIDAGQFETIENFINVDEPGAEPLLGEGDEVVIAENGDVMTYGDGGAGKTTLMNDLAFHLAAGDDWCGIRVARPARVAIIENEGPRPLFRRKLKRKHDAWTGSPVDDRILVLATPWARFTFTDETHREWLAAKIGQHELDVVFLGPLTRIGMNEAGTLQDVRDFCGLLAKVRDAAGRRVTFALVHHENKGGQVSGAWEGAGDTLLHVQGQGHGRTRLVFQKARWSSSWHGKSLQLLWADGDSFTATDSQADENALADSIIEAARANGGCSWNTIETTVGGNSAQARTIRDRLLNGGRLTNTSESRTMALWDTEDPMRPTRPDADAPQDAPGGEGT